MMEILQDTMIMSLIVSLLIAIDVYLEKKEGKQ